MCVYSLFLAAQRGLLLQASSTISAAAAALLALAEWFLLLLLFRRRFGLEDGYQSSPELVLAARARPPSPFFASLSGEEIESECVRKEGRQKGDKHFGKPLTATEI